MDKFSEAELEGRPKALLVLKALVEEYGKGWEIKEEVVEDKTRWDYLLVKGEKKILVEVKHRKYSMDLNWDWMLDGKKYEYLRSCIGKDGVVGAFYVSTHPEGGRVFNLAKEIGSWKNNAHQKYTCMNSQIIVTRDIYFKAKEACFEKRV